MLGAAAIARGEAATGTAVHQAACPWPRIRCQGPDTGNLVSPRFSGRTSKSRFRLPTPVSRTPTGSVNRKQGPRKQQWGLPKSYLRIITIIYAPDPSGRRVIIKIVPRNEIKGFTPFTAGAPEGFGLRFELADAPDGAPNGSEFWGTPHTRGRAPKLQARRSEQGLRPQLKPQRRVGRHGHASPTTSSSCARGAGGRGAPPHPNPR